jgi:hypothetical protein
MNKTIKSALVFCALVTGCATTPVPTSLARPVPFERIQNPSLLKKIANHGELIVKRDEGLSASACDTQIFINGQQLAVIGTGEKITIYLTAGNYMLGAIARGICGGGLVEAKVSVSENGSQTYRVSYGSSGEFSLQPTAF